MQTTIIFTASGSSSAFGNFAPGDSLRCSAEQAAHFVDDACCAKYAEQAAPAEPAPAEPAPAAAPAKTLKKRAGAAE